MEAALLLIFVIATEHTTRSIKIDDWVRNVRSVSHFDETSGFSLKLSSQYPSWYPSVSSFRPTQRAISYDYFPWNFTDYNLDFDNTGFCTLFNSQQSNNGILLIGGQSTVDFTIQLASLFNAKHCSVTCDSAISCSYCICGGDDSDGDENDDDDKEEDVEGQKHQHKLSFIRSDTLSTDRSFLVGQCPHNNKQQLKPTSADPAFCQPWVSRSLLSQYSLIVLNDDIPPTSDVLLERQQKEGILTSIRALEGNTKSDQLLFLRSSYVAQHNCTSTSNNKDDEDGLEEYRDAFMSRYSSVFNTRVKMLDVFTPSLSYKYRHAPVTNATSQRTKQNSGNNSTSADKTGDNTTTRDRRQHRRQRLLSATNSAATEGGDTAIQRNESSATVNSKAHAVVVNSSKRSDGSLRRDRTSGDRECIPYSTNAEAPLGKSHDKTAVTVEENPEVAWVDFLLLWSAMLYTQSLEHYKYLVFDTIPCCTATSPENAMQELVVLEFAIVNYLNTYIQVRQSAPIVWPHLQMINGGGGGGGTKQKKTNSNSNNSINSSNDPPQRHKQRLRRLQQQQELPALTVTKRVKITAAPHGTLRTRNPYDTAILSCSDKAYVEAFQPWYDTKARLSTALHNNTIRAYIIAIDRASCDHLRSMNQLYFCFYYSPSFVKAFPAKGHSLRLAIGVAKILYPLVFLQLGINALFSEMDIFWRGDPLCEDLQAPSNNHHHIQVSAHNDFWPIFYALPEELNIGIFYVRACNTSVVLFQDMLRFTGTHPHKMASVGTWDQKLFDLFVRTKDPGPKEAPPCCQALHYPNHESFINTKERIVWRRLPCETYTHNQGKLMTILPSTRAIHISWGINPPSERIYCANQVGFLNTTRFDDVYKGMKCFG